MALVGDEHVLIGRQLIKDDPVNTEFGCEKGQLSLPLFAVIIDSCIEVRARAVQHDCTRDGSLCRGKNHRGTHFLDMITKLY